MLFAFSDEFDAPRLNVVDFMKEPSRRCTIDELETNFELEYPPLSNRDAYVRDMQLRADPGCFVDNRPGVPYSQNTKDFTIVFTTELVVRNSDRYVIQFISAQLLLDFVEEYAPISRDSDGNLLPPASYIECVNDTRIRVVGDTAVPSDVWVCYVYGNRYTLGWPMSKEGVRGFEVEVLDFNQLALKRDARLSTASDYSGSLRTQPSQVSRHRAFNDQVETCLPYRRQSLFLADVHRHCQAMCAEDSIVIVDVSFLYSRKCAQLTRTMAYLGGMPGIPSARILTRVDAFQHTYVLVLYRVTE